MQAQHAQFRKGVTFLAAAIAAFASIPIFLKHFTGFLDAWTVNGIRYGVATCVWLPVVLRHVRSERADAGGNVWAAALVPALVNVVMQIGWAFAPYHNDAVLIGFVIRCSFLFSILFGFCLLPQERGAMRSPLFWTGSVGIVLGLLVMYGEGLRAGGTSPLGLFIILGTAALWGLYGVLVRRRMKAFGARLSFGVISVYTAAVLCGLMFAFGDWRAAARVALADWGLLTVSAVVGIAVSHVIFYRAVHTLGPVVTEGGLCVLPFATALGAYVFLGERLTPPQWLGGVVIAGSCLVLVLSKRMEAPAAGSA